MTQYIDKAVVVAELEDWRDKIEKGIITLRGRQRADASFEYEILGLVRDFIDRLDVKEETPSKELADEIDALSKRYPEISFAKLSRIAVRIAKWQKEQDKKGE